MNETFVVDVDSDGSLVVFSALSGKFLIRLTDELLADDELLEQALNVAAFEESAARNIEAAKKIDSE